jgi:hypothetical protein
MKLIKDAPLRLLVQLVAHTKLRCQTHKASYEDLYFIEHSTEYAEFLGLDIDLRQTITFLKLLNKPACSLRAPMQKYVFNSKVIELHTQGFSLREIVKYTGVTKKNVERMLRENPDLPGI